MAMKMGAKFVTGLSLVTGLLLGGVSEGHAQKARSGGIGYSAPVAAHYESYTVTRVILNYNGPEGSIDASFEGFNDNDASNTPMTGSHLPTLLNMKVRHHPMNQFSLSKADVRLENVKVDYNNPVQHNLASFDANLRANMSNSNIEDMFVVSGNSVLGTSGYTVKEMHLHGQNVEVVINNSRRGMDASGNEERIESMTKGKGVSVDFLDMQRLVTANNPQVPTGTIVSEQTTSTAFAPRSQYQGNPRQPGQYTPPRRPRQ